MCIRDRTESHCFLEEHFFIDHQDSEESEEDGEGITFEEFKETEGFKSLLKYLGGTPKYSDVS